MEEKEELIKLINAEFALELSWKLKLEELRDQLAAQVHSLINENFERLVAILYRVDVSEDKLKSLLKNHPDLDAGVIIADLIIERQLQKIKSRREFPTRDNNIDDSEKW
jgi:hypothetical protein